MDIKERIDALAEAEAKAALFNIILRIGVLLFRYKCAWASDSFGESSEDCANTVLSDVLKEVRK